MVIVFSVADFADFENSWPERFSFGVIEMCPAIVVCIVEIIDEDLGVGMPAPPKAKGRLTAPSTTERIEIVLQLIVTVLSPRVFTDRESGPHGINGSSPPPSPSPTPPQPLPTTLPLVTGFADPLRRQRCGEGLGEGKSARPLSPTAPTRERFVPQRCPWGGPRAAGAVRMASSPMLESRSWWRVDRWSRRGHAAARCSLAGSY